MNELRVFHNSEFGELGVMLIDGKEHFPATACAKVLGHENPQRAIRSFCKGVTEMVTPSAGGQQKVKYIPEGDLYRLIIRSKLPSAERFERWVFDEVLPAIRRQGAYVPDMTAVIAQAVQAAVTQTIQLMSPYLFTAQNEQKPKPRIRRRITSLIDQLETPLQMEMEELIMDPANSYVQISDYFRERYGVLISKSTIGRYAQRMYEALEAQENAKGNS